MSVFFSLPHPLFFPPFLSSSQLPLVTARGAQLAALFMLGVETALFANDACGAPVPWLMCCPWLYFDGKLFHAKLIRANCARSLVEVSVSVRSFGVWVLLILTQLLVYKRIWLVASNVAHNAGLLAHRGSSPVCAQLFWYFKHNIKHLIACRCNL